MSENRSLSVSEAMGLARQALEGVRVQVIGEVSEFSDKPGYKAAYFTVCDGEASMPCLMWRDAYEASGVALRCGIQVEITGYFSAYVPKGRMQFVVRRLEPAGEGRLRMQVAELARRLEAEGLMRAERKRQLEPFPERIAVVTSPRGKAIHDVLRTLRRRYPLAEVLVAGVPVEGESAAASIVEGLRVASDARPDVILLVRGGGSYEDLMPFNSELVARAIAASTVPVVSGIGHEPDTTIADMVADLRASTPTAAAEASAPAIEAMAAALGREGRALGRALLHRTREAAHRVTRIAERPAFRDAFAVLGPSAQSLDEARVRLASALPAKLERDAQRLDSGRVRLIGAGSRFIERHEAIVALTAARIDDLSPLKILARGYAAAFEPDGKTVVRSIEQLSVGQGVLLKLSDGNVGCDVTHVEREER